MLRWAKATAVTHIRITINLGTNWAATVVSVLRTGRSHYKNKSVDFLTWCRYSDGFFVARLSQVFQFFLFGFFVFFLSLLMMMMVVMSLFHWSAKQIWLFVNFICYDWFFLLFVVYGWRLLVFRLLLFLNHYNSVILFMMCFIFRFLFRFLFSNDFGPINRRFVRLLCCRFLCALLRMLQ